MRNEAREMAQALRDGDGPTVFEILFESQYAAPSDMAKLLQRVAIQLNSAEP